MDFIYYLTEKNACESSQVKIPMERVWMIHSMLKRVIINECENERRKFGNIFTRIGILVTVIEPFNFI